MSRHDRRRGRTLCAACSKAAGKSVTRGECGADRKEPPAPKCRSCGKRAAHPLYGARCEDCWAVAQPVLNRRQVVTIGRERFTIGRYKTGR